MRPENFHRLVAERISDPQLRGNLRRARDTSLSKRASVVTDYPEWEEMRRTAHALKRDVLGRLPELLEQFERNAVERGMHVLYADDAREACGLVIDIVRRHGGSLAVKSKSMTTEEIGLGHALSDADIDPIETDLGEYIVQLAGEMPSHITAPALHKSREQIGRLFADVHGIEYTSDPAALTAVARTVLRDRFLRADVGISGVNFAVASTGALCIVENEGNARMSISLPSAHIAVMGVEKLVQNDAALAHMLSMLARSATGQRTTCYTSFIRGPRRNDEHDGPDHVYVIVLDNGRSRLLSDPHLRDALMCIRCGACLNVCPVYEKIGGHSYGSVYPGPIGSVLTPVFSGLGNAKALPFASSLCGACTEICPVGIDLHHMLLRHRATTVRTKLSPRVEQWIMRGFAWLMQHPRLYRLAGRSFSTFAPLLSGTGDRPRIPVWSAHRDFPIPPRSSFKDLWEARTNDHS